MPTPVNAAKQCLTEAAAHALDEAVSVARRRGHAQTTSLHAVSAFLSIRSSPLREACLRAHNEAFYPRVQFKALEFCLSVSLDRLPTSQTVADEPPISNSLMAAIKRSQANQRRHPDNGFASAIKQQQSQEHVNPGIKVETQHLILSILDDPIVSRVFNEAGFSSFDMKISIMRPFQSFFRYPRLRRPPSLFLFNLEENSDTGYRPFRFPFSGSWANCGWSENSRRIGEVLVKMKRRNPLLIGYHAYDALQSFLEAVKLRREYILPLELCGVNVISVEEEVLKMVSENWKEDSINSMFEEVGSMAAHGLGAGLVVSLGELKAFVGGDDAVALDVVNCVVRKLTKLIEIHSGRVWLIGSAATCEIYLKFLSRFPSIEENWDLHILPITSVPPSIGRSCFTSSLMGSFVPFGGFLSHPSNFTSSLSGSYQCFTHCHPCNEKCKQEVAAGFSSSVGDRYQKKSFPSWLQTAELGTNNGSNVLEAKDDKSTVSSSAEGLLTKWDNIFPYLPHSQTHPTEGVHPEYPFPPAAVRFQFFEEKKVEADNTRTNTNYASSEERKYKSMDSIPIHMQKHLPSELGNQGPLEFTSKDEDFLFKLVETPSKPSTPNLGDVRTSPTYDSPVTTDLGLGIVSQSNSLEQNRLNGNDFKMLFDGLIGRVGRQDEALRIISQTITSSQINNGMREGSSPRGDIWLNFLGPDIFAKKKIALALAEIVCGNRDNLIFVDFSSSDGVFHESMISDHKVMIGFDVQSRGKTIVDFIAEGLRKAPTSVVFIENVHHAHPPAQNSLLRAIGTGRFSDSHGMEVGISNAIFVLASSFTNIDKASYAGDETSSFPEERIITARGCPFQLIVKDRVEDHGLRHKFLNKRKLGATDELIRDHANMILIKRPHKGSNMFLDLNLPAEDTESNLDTDCRDIENEPILGNAGSWLEALWDRVNETVHFKPFNYDALAETVLVLICESFCDIFGSESVLEIDLRVIDQILSVACLSDGKQEVKGWVEQVLSRRFREAKNQYRLISHSTLKLLTSDPISIKEQARGAFLPSEIILKQQP
ncbi:hypothetical protein Nepgr_032399 [Nepenthes gracilis]|uniref:Clp R domain-containing protein n=1 Tax=Nepenthes gracilis TaxID=150966 RepID=A0AAD3Y895_NEPGR|nr:hypothetical protein Nepgr_032399 [Nepenthes gracilis]